MQNTTLNQWTTVNSIQDYPLEIWVENFLFDRKIQNMAKGTLYFYKMKLKLFTIFCGTQGVSSVLQIDATLIRQYLYHLESTGHNAGGVNGCYRALKAFLRWWESEIELDGWKNPIAEVKTPKNPVEIKEPVNLDEVMAMIETCPRDTLTGLRDRCIQVFLLDTGVRSFELLAINIEDINLANGEIIIKMGKGRKSRTVYIGSKTRKWIKSYLRFRTDNHPALWVSKSNDRLTYWGLKASVRYRAKLAKVKPPEIHAYRRWFCLTMLRAGISIYTIQNLMGHADLQTLTRYLKLTNQDNRNAHNMASPVDNHF